MVNTRQTTLASERRNRCIRATGSRRDTSTENPECVSFGMKKLKSKFAAETAKIGYALLWLIGVPLPILLLIYLMRGH